MKSIAVTVYGDATQESDENFALTLSNISGGYILGRSVAVGTTLNDDAGAAGTTLGIGDASVVKADAGSQSLLVPITLSTPRPSAITMNYTITPGTATRSAQASGGGDFGGPLTGTIKIPAGGLTRILAFSIWPDTNPDSDESFTITLSRLGDPTVTLIRASGTGTIIDH